MYKHNKKRNVGLLVEFLSLHMSVCLVEQRVDDSNKAKKIWRKYFSKGSELYKEYSVFNSLYTANLSNREIAIRLLERSKAQCEKINVQKLDAEKTALIKECNENLNDSNFYNRPVRDYKNIATIQILINSYSGKNPLGLRETVELEDKVVDHILNKKKVPNKSLSESVLRLRTDDVDTLVVKIMQEKFEEKYKKVLSEEQQKIVSLYSFSEKDEAAKKNLLEVFQNIRHKTYQKIQQELKESKDSLLNNKLNHIKGLIEECSRETPENLVRENGVVLHMTFSKLHEELKGE